MIWISKWYSRRSDRSVLYFSNYSVINVELAFQKTIVKYEISTTLRRARVGSYLYASTAVDGDFKPKTFRSSSRI